LKEQQKYLKKSLSLLQKINPALAYRLSFTDPVEVEFCLTQQKERNLKRFYENHTYYYHSPLHANQEAREWFRSLDLKLATVIFVYGIGLGYYYEAVKAWLKQQPNHSLVFLEEDLSVLYRLFETELGSQLLKDPQVQIVYFQNLIADKPLFNEISWTYFESSVVISSLKLYEETNPEGYLQLQHQLSYDIAQKKALVEEYMQYGGMFFRNLYPNLLEIPHAYWGNGLFEKFSQVPAIICGAGPSLNKNMDLLSSLKERALLFAGGSALNALIPRGIIPHFGVAIDPDEQQYRRVAVTQPYCIPFFYRSRLFHKALIDMTGPRLYLTGAGGYETSRWFEQQLNIDGEDVDEGHNVVNFSLQIAQALGCNPIILVGVDLAFTDQKYYADEIVANLKLTEKDLKIDVSVDAETVLKKDIYGKPVYTLWKWITEATWISEFAQLHPEITVINATEGGLGFEGISNSPLQEVAQEFLQDTREEIKHIGHEICKHPLNHIHREQIFQLIQEMKNSLNHCIDLISKLIDAKDKQVTEIKNGGLLQTYLEGSATSLLENELETEIGYQFLLDMFKQVYVHKTHRWLLDLQSPNRRDSKKKRALKKLELEKQRLIFLREVAQFNCDLIQHGI
jgi:hypothetical protein